MKVRNKWIWGNCKPKAIDRNKRPYAVKKE